MVSRRHLECTLHMGVPLVKDRTQGIPLVKDRTEKLATGSCLSVNPDAIVENEDEHLSFRVSETELA